MSSNIIKYNIIYDGNVGFTCYKSIYCYYNNCGDFQKWCNEDGTPLDFGSVTDNEAIVTAKCIANIPTNDDCYYLEVAESGELPHAVIDFLLYNK